VLRQRLLTIAVLLPLFVWCVLAMPTAYFALCVALMVLIGAWEWAGLIGLTARAQRVAYLAVMAVALGAAAGLLAQPLLRQFVLAGAVLWWAIALIWLRRYSLDPQRFSRSHRPGGPLHFPPHWLFGMLGIVVLVPAWLGLVVIHGNDIAGRLWGRTRLAPAVSPGKSWEGVYGGLAAALLGVLGGGLWFGLGWRSLVTLMLLGFVTVLFSVVGDLFESMIKRLAGVKDSGRLLPGHGGMLDRIDSVTAAAPVFALGLIWQGVVA